MTAISKRAILTCLTLLALHNGSAYAGCDACLQSAIQSATAQISTSLRTLEATAQTNVTATQALTNTVTTSSASLNALMEAQHILLLNGLDAAAIKLEMSTSAVADTVEKTSDHLAATISQTIKDYGRAQQFIKNRDQYGPMSLPMSGDIAANRAPLLASAMMSFEGKRDDAMTKFRQWALAPPANDETRTIRQSKADARLLELAPNLDELAKGVIEQQSIEDIAELYRLMLLPVPIASESLPPQKRINYLREVDKLSRAYYALITDLLMKAPLLSTEGWDMGYISVDKVDVQTSISEFIRAETERKLLSPAWHFDMKTKTEAGLLREQIQQREITNYLLSQLIEQENISLNIMAVQ